MGEERLTRAESIFQAAADLLPAERASLLSERCGDDADLRTLVERLLARHDDGMGSFLEPDASPTRLKTEDEPAPRTAERIGPYRILERLGEGGFGEVFAAEQSEPVRRRVALKILKAGLDTRDVLARFEAERQALALMDHPNIARVLDAGETQQGRPYFVMELIHGEPLTDYCDHHRLTVEERLGLFLPVCQAIQHAHQKGVIHRDVKPSNVLVTLVDGKPVPKVIDFGIAKATAQSLTEKTLYTLRGQVIGTPAYMSPEQAEMSGLDVDTRTDVYSLGVLLYELLTGRLPFEMKTLREAGLDAMRRIIREQEPPRPSTRVSTLGEDARGPAARRRTDPARWRRTLRRELDWIVMKALEKDRSRRYETVSGLAGDVGRYLADEPVLAGPPSALYRVGKYVKRHRVAVGFAATIAAGVILAFVLVTAQNARIAGARDEAEVVTRTLEGMLASVDPTKSGRDVTVKEMLDQTSQTLGERFKDRPLVEARLRHTVGHTYYMLGEHGAAEQHLDRAVELFGDDISGLVSRRELGWVYDRQGRYDEAVALQEENLEICRRAYGEEDPQTIKILEGLATAYGRTGRGAEAQAIREKVVDWTRRERGDEDLSTLTAMNNLGVSYRDEGDWDKAEAMLEEVVEVAQRTVGEKKYWALQLAMSNLARVYRKQGRLEEAEAMSQRALAGQRQRLGEEHYLTLWTMSGLALVYQDQGRYGESKALFMETLEIQRRALGEGHPYTLSSMESIASCYSSEGDPAAAEATLLEALEISRRANGDDHEETNDLRYSLACRAAIWGDREQAISYLREALAHDYPGPSGCCGEPETIHDDPDLVSLHGDPEFEAIAEEFARGTAEQAEAGSSKN